MRSKRFSVRMPESTEIALQYQRQPQNADYRSLEWVSYPWSITTYSPAQTTTVGKFGVVRYRIEGLSKDDLRVLPTESMSWHCTNNVRAAIVAASEFYREKLELEKEAERRIREAIQDLRKGS
jgi:hypothetical protein